MNHDIYISCDIESDGPIPGPNSMLSLGAAAFSPKSQDPKKPFSTFSVNFDLLEGATPDPDTMKWWEGQQKAWRACRLNTQPPDQAIHLFIDWVNGLDGVSHNGKSNAVFVAYPAGYDFTFVYWYIRRFGLESPFSFSALDIKTFAMATLGESFRSTVKRNMPKRWFHKDTPHTHVALEDAIGQGILFMNMLEESRRKR